MSGPEAMITAIVLAIIALYAPERAHTIMQATIRATIMVSNHVHVKFFDLKMKAEATAELIA